MLPDASFDEALEWVTGSQIALNSSWEDMAGLLESEFLKECRRLAGEKE